MYGGDDCFLLVLPKEISLFIGTGERQCCKYIRQHQVHNCSLDILVKMDLTLLRINHHQNVSHLLNKIWMEHLKDLTRIRKNMAAFFQIQCHTCLQVVSGIADSLDHFNGAAMSQPMDRFGAVSANNKAARFNLSYKSKITARVTILRFSFHPRSSDDRA